MIVAWVLGKTVPICQEPCHDDNGLWFFDAVPQVGRSMEKLQALETEVKRKHGCRTLIIKVSTSF